jgi:septal ring factor EnvC (AmiA/AmiB activator)
MVIRLKYFLLLFTLSIVCFAQTEEIRKSKSELSSLKTEIENLEKELASKSAAEKKSFEAVENLNRQNYLINRIISELRAEISNKEKDISFVERKIIRIESGIKVLKDNYARYVTAVYKKGEPNELESLLNVSSIQQALMRTYYLQVFAKQRVKDLDKLNKKKYELEENKILLKVERNERLLLVKEKNDERNILAQKLNEKKALLKSIEKNKSELQKLITAKKEAQKKIENLIATLIEAEERRIKELALNQKNKIVNEGSAFDYDLSTSSFASFAELKGKMIWPLHNGQIIRKFGENRHKLLNTVTLNYGVDIKAGADKNVRSVGEGVVAAIDWLPGYGNVIIVSHKNEFRTVYSHVSEIFISEGDKVKAGSVLALVDESIDGHVLHFEIWKGRDKVNPELWLAKK